MNNLKEIANIVYDYMTTEEGVIEVAKRNKISRQTLNRYVTLIEEKILTGEIYSNPDLRMFIDINDNINLIISSFMNGIQKDDGSRKDYDFVDFYKQKLVSSRTLLSISKKNLSYIDYINIKQFLDTNNINLKKSCYDYKYNEYPIKYFLKENIEFNCIRDDNGMPISGTGHTVTIEEKQTTIDFMNKYKIPFTYPNYNKVLFKCINQELNEEKIKIYKK